MLQLYILHATLIFNFLYPPSLVEDMGVLKKIWEPLGFKYSQDLAAESSWCLYIGASPDSLINKSRVARLTFMLGTPLPLFGYPGEHNRMYHS